MIISTSVAALYCLLGRQCPVAGTGSFRGEAPPARAKNTPILRHCCAKIGAPTGAGGGRARARNSGVMNPPTFTGAPRRDGRLNAAFVRGEHSPSESASDLAAARRKPSYLANSSVLMVRKKDHTPTDDVDVLIGRGKLMVRRCAKRSFLTTVLNVCHFHFGGWGGGLCL